MAKIQIGTTLGDELIASLKEGIDILEGRSQPARSYPMHARVDVKAIRAGMKLSQAQFARRFGLTVGAVRNWEQGLRHPDAPTRVLLKVIARRPDIIDEVLAEDQNAAA